MGVRGVGYVRMSTSMQERSPAEQQAAIEAHCRKNGITLLRVYADLGISGDDTRRRPQFRQMIADGAAGKFDRIVVFDRSRFGRFDSIDFGKWVSPLRDAGVALETLDRGIEDWEDLGGRILSMVEQEGKHSLLRDLSRTIVRSKTRKALENNGYSGPTPYGYSRRVKVEGRYHISELVIDPQKSQVVKRIFTMYAAAGGSLHNIADALNADGIPSPRGRQLWRKNTIQRILLNEVYRGDAVWGRRQTGKYSARQGSEIVGRRRGAKVERVDPIVHPDAVPAIVSRELYERVQRLMKERAKATRPQAAVRPLSGLVFCGTCGRPMHSDGANGFRCSGSQTEAAPRGERCSSARVPSAPLIEALVNGLKHRLSGPVARKRLVAGIEKRLQTRAGGQAAARKQLEARRRALQAELTAGLEKIPMMPAGLVGDYAATLDRKRAELARVEADLVGNPDTLPIEPSATAAALVKRIDELLGAGITKGSPTLANAALAALNTRVTVTRTAGELSADIEIGGVAPNRNTLGTTAPKAGGVASSPTRACSGRPHHSLPLVEWRVALAHRRPA